MIASSATWASFRPCANGAGSRSNNTYANAFTMSATYARPLWTMRSTLNASTRPPVKSLKLSRRCPVASKGMNAVGSVLIWLLLVYDNPRALTINQCVRIQFGSLGGDHGGIRLISDNETCDASDDYQHPLRGFIPAWRL